MLQSMKPGRALHDLAWFPEALRRQIESGRYGLSSMPAVKELTGTLTRINRPSSRYEASPQECAL